MSLTVALDATPLIGNRTGVGWYVHGLINALADLASAEARSDTIELRPYAVSWRGQGELKKELPEGAIPTHHPMAARPLHFLWRHTQGPVIEHWTGQVDLIHGTNFVVPPARQAARIVTVHDLTSWRFPEMCTKAVLLYPVLVRRAVEKGAWVHTNSRFVAGEIQAELNISPERIIVAPPGIPDLPLPKEDTQAREKAAAHGISLAGSDTYILALGTIEPRKDLPTLVKAFDRLASVHKKVRLVIAGAPGWGIETFDQAIAHAAHSARIVRLGYVTATDRTALLAGAAVFAYPSVYEGFGFPPLEAMQMGTPVVTTKAGALPEVIGDAALFVSVGKPDELADALRTVIETPTVQYRLTTAGSERVKQYNWPKCAQHTLQMYRKITT